MNRRVLVSLVAMFLPWPLRRFVLVHMFGYVIHKTARIGYSLICPMHLEMGAGSRIGHLTFCKLGVELVRLGEHAIVGNLNWITGELLSSSHFVDEDDRHSELLLHDHAAITNRHYIDCTATVTIGRFSTFAGIHSIILSHSIDLNTSQQSSKPVSIGAYCFVGTASVLIAGTALPDYSVLGANSLLNKHYTEPYQLYAGNPARPLKHLAEDSKYFTRVRGYVD